ncbi:MAG TPA: efflux RND transporter permease subunit [Gemmataceae bacterium]|nr:efflux RND transporter permease subunit [Gemmataceae bacterium]
MFSSFFINRPIFASVLSIVIVLAGTIALFTLPVAQYPEIAPPTVEVSAYYPGANAKVVADTVAAPIEQQVNGVENMMYMSSQCTNDGKYTLTVTFEPGTDLNISQVLVQNRESLAEPILPDLVKRRGISVKKKSSNVLMIVNLFSKDNSRTSLELSNYATIQIRDELSRLPGVGDITYLGQRDYSMRLWLDPQKLATYNLNAQDVIAAVQAQNIQVAAGQIGQPPTPNGQVSQYIITTLGRLENTEQFERIIVKNSAASLIYLRDVANIELGAQSYDQSCTLDGKPSVALSVYQLPGSNALDVAKRVKDRMKQLKRHFPPGIEYDIVYDTTPFIKESISEVGETLFDAIVLVAVVVLLFLQNWRSALIPLIAVPVAVIGTFAVMAVMGFSLNNLTLFGLVLAIGIVVDDAIVVVEAVEHHIEHGMRPKEATIKAMEQVSGPVVAIGLVLSAVFIPCAFITGIIGQFFRQFALTIAVSTVISAFNSLTLSPALSALLLKRRAKGHFEALPWFAFVPLGAWLGHKIGHHYAAPLLAALNLQAPAEVLDALRVWGPIAAGLLAGLLVGLLELVLGLFAGQPINFLLGWSFRQFNRAFDFSTTAYTRLVSGLLRVSLLVAVVYGGLLVLTWWGFTQTPTGFIPQQDKGYLLVNVQLPDAASVTRTQDVVRQIEEIALKTDGIKHTVAITGQSILLNANASNFGALYLMLDDFDNRTRANLSSDAIATALQERLAKELPHAIVNIFGAPPVEGLGTAGGFKIIVQDTGDNGLASLQGTADKVVNQGEKNPHLQGVFTSFRADTPWLELIIDRIQAKDRGVSIDDIRTTLESTIGPYYINDFNRFGRTWQVNVQARHTFRQSVDDIKQLKVRNSQNEMVPLADFASVGFASGPVMLMRYNMYPSAAIHADAGPDTSSGQAIAYLQEATEEQLPQTMRTEWTELALLQQQTGDTAMWVFLLAVVLVFLVLAAQYESWSLPLAVILVVPMCLLCAIAGVVMAKMDVNVFTQIGFLVLVGLACKNAILIVEFAKAQRELGMSRKEATLAACQLRLRPIIMTSFAFILGVVPLMLSDGAGAEMRRTLGTAVFAGMLGVTLFGIFLTPVFYYVIQGFKDRRPPTMTDIEEDWPVVEKTAPIHHARETRASSHTTATATSPLRPT